MPASEFESSQAYLAAIVESSDDAIISKDLSGIVRSFNPAAERLFGYEAGDIVGRPITLLIPPDRLDEEERILASLRRGERIDHQETVRMTRDGRRVDVVLSVSPVRDAQGRIIGASKILRDITERKRAAAALAAQQQWFRVTLASIGDAVIASDAAGLVTYMNEVAETLTGWTSADASGRPLAEVFHIVNEETRARVENPAEKVLRDHVTVGLANHTVLIAKSGAECPIDDSAAPIFDLDNEVIGVVLVFHDVTERRRTEKARQAAAVEREELLARERQARADAERADRVKDEFVAMVSHELRTPLSAILGWIEVLRRKPEDTPLVRHGLEIIDRNARTQSQLVADLLDVSRIVSGKLLLAPEAVELHRLVSECVDAMQPAAQNRGIEIHAAIDPVPRTIADPARLRQVVLNLLSNAAKFTPKGGRIDVRLHGSDTSAEIVVRDSGIGIRPDEMDGLFQRFYQSGPSITRRFAGLGLGLSIAKHLVTLHGGNIHAASEGEGKGATFTVTLPLTAADVERRVPPAEAADRGERVSLDGLTILVVEDEEDMRDMVALVLSEHGARALTASTAAEALALLEQAPDVLVSDIRLPEMSGYELVQRIRQRKDAIGAIPAVALKIGRAHV